MEFSQTKFYSLFKRIMGQYYIAANIEDMEQTAVEYLISMVKSPEWQDMYIWHKEDVFKTALAMERIQKKEDGRENI